MSCALIAITGRSGSGKSQVRRLYESQGWPVCDADLVARQVLEPGSDCLPLLQQRFGADILDEQGNLRRRLLADRAFATPEGTADPTSITHPEILRRILEQRRQAEKAGSPLFFVDGAVIELPEPGPTVEWVPISAFIGALYALIPAEQVAAVMQNEAALKPALAGLALLSSDAAPGGMINLLDQRVSEWLALVNLTLDQVRDQMAGGEA